MAVMLLMMVSWVGGTALTSDDRRRAVDLLRCFLYCGRRNFFCTNFYKTFEDLRKYIAMPSIAKRRKIGAVEEISFDEDARSQYLTGFHKRKQQRIKQAKEAAAQREREEKIKERQQVRLEAVAPPKLGRLSDLI